MNVDARRYREFDTNEIGRLLDIDPRRAEGWAETQLVVPRRVGRGPGSRRRWTLANVAEGAVVLAMQEIVGERSPLTRLAVRAVGDKDRMMITRDDDGRPQLTDPPSSGAIAEQIATGELMDAKDNVLTVVAGTREIALAVVGFGPNAAEIVEQQRGQHFICMVPLRPRLAEILERFEALERESP